MRYQVFVYGTLLRGMSRANAMANSMFLGHAETRGDLYDLGHYPGLVDGVGLVLGELHEVDARTLAKLDVIEGYDPDIPEQSLYRRETRVVTCLNDGRATEAEVYLYNEEVAASPRLCHGDYRGHAVLQHTRNTFYVAYGSNLNQERLESRIGKVTVATRGYLAGYQLYFNKKNPDGSACANLRYTGSGELPFVAYRLNGGFEQIRELDAHEGVPEAYRRLCLPFPTGNGNQHALGYVYVANPNHLGNDLQPKELYLSHIRKGYALHGFEWQKNWID